MGVIECAAVTMIRTSTRDCRDIADTAELRRVGVLADSDLLNGIEGREELRRGNAGADVHCADTVHRHRQKAGLCAGDGEISTRVRMHAALRCQLAERAG